MWWIELPGTPLSKLYWILIISFNFGMTVLSNIAITFKYLYNLDKLWLCDPMWFPCHTCVIVITKRRQSTQWQCSSVSGMGRIPLAKYWLNGNYMDAGRQHPPLTPVTLNLTDRSKVLLAASRGHRPGYYVNNVRTRHRLLGELSTSIEWTDQLPYFIVFTRIGFGTVHFIGKLQIKGGRHKMCFGVPVLEQVEDG